MNQMRYSCVALVGWRSFVPWTAVAASLLCAPVSGAWGEAPSLEPSSAGILIDAVVASVNDKPITLTDLCERLSPKRKLSLSQAAQDPEAQKVLEGIITERLLEEEANVKRLSASDQEVQEYVSEVANRNGLSMAEFQKALASEGRNFESYKNQVKFDILKTKLSSSVARGGVSVSDAEIEKYLEDHPDFTSGGVSLRLRRILVSSTDRSPDDLRTRVNLVMEDLKNDKNFADVASHYSDGPEGVEGGSLGIIAEKDLSSDIAEAVNDLKEGKFSEPIEGPQGFQIFFLEQRIGKASTGDDESDEEDQDDEDATSEAMRAEVRKILQQQKTQERLSTYFAREILKNHTVDKKM